MNDPAWGRTLGALREAAKPAWRDYVGHAFVRALGDGTLPESAFRHYLTQDYVFLVHFARAWAMAVLKSDSPGEMRLAAATVHALLDEEMALHVQTCAGWGIDEETLQRTPEAPANLAYTRFVIDCGVQGDLLDLLVALAPCVFGYGEIGRLLSLSGAKNNRYQAWIDTYAGDDYQQACWRVGELLDAVADRRIGEDLTGSVRWQTLLQRFRTACELEAAFWQMGLDG